MNIKRILIVANFIPPISGGAEQVAWESAKRLAKDYDVTYLAMGDYGSYSRKGVKVHLIPNKKNTIIYYSTFGKRYLSDFFSDKEFDLIHFHSATPWPFLCRKYTRKSFKVITCHGSDVFPKKTGLRKRLLLSSVKTANKIITPSKWLGEYIKTSYNFESSFLPNGVETSKFQPDSKIKRDSDSVFFVGRKVKRKGSYLLLRVAEKLPNINFFFAGSDFPKETRNLPKNVEYLGFVDDLQECFNKYTVSVFPSHWENNPVVGLEAMSCGSPTIATSLGFSEFIDNKKDGIIITINEKKNPLISYEEEEFLVKELVQKINFLLSNKKAREKISYNCRNKSKNYSWTLTDKKYRKLLEKFLMED